MMRSAFWIAGTMLVAALAPIAYAAEPATDLTASGAIGWPVPGEATALRLGMHDLGSDPGTQLPSFDVALRIDGATAATWRVDGFRTGEVREWEWVALPGRHLLELVVDVANEIPESREDNNVWSFVVDVSEARPDLAVEDLVVTTDALGTSATASFRLCNHGDAYTSALQPWGRRFPDAAIYRERHHALDAWSAGTFVTAPALAPGSCAERSFTWDRDVALGDIEFRVEAAMVGHYVGSADADASNDAQHARAAFLGAGAGVGFAANVPLV